MSLLYFESNINNNNQTKVKIAGFDFDNTLVKTLSGKIFPINEDDWEYLYPNILDKLNTLKDNYCLVIFSNQNGVGLGKTDKNLVTNRFTKFIDSTKLGWHLCAALNKDGYRKPNTMMWEFMENKFDIDKENSFYVGDAAGRIKGWSNNKKAKKDFSCSDRKFALNLGIKFFTPEEFFLNQEPTQDYSLESFDPRNYQIQSNIYQHKKSNYPEMVIMVGSQGSGKSSFVKKYFPDYEIISMDKIKNKSKCLKLTQKYIQENKSFVIDNTNPDSLSRKQYIDIAKKDKYYIRCFEMKTERKLAEHMNICRFKLKYRDNIIPKIAFNIYFKKYEKPEIEEGFDEIIYYNPEYNFNKSELKVFMEYN